MSESAGNRHDEGPTERLGVVNTDRPCIRCGFNLHGQPIAREPHYQMVMARCPECGQVASLQEYPALGRWAGRLAGALALLWLAIVLLAGFGTAAGLHAFAKRAALAVVYPAGQRLAVAYRAYALEKAEAITDPIMRQQQTAWIEQNSVETWPIVGNDFKLDGSAAAVLATIPKAERVDWKRGRAIGWMALWAAPVGMGWAVLAPHLRRRGLAALATLLMLGGGVWTAIAAVRGTQPRVWGGYYWGVDVAYDAFGWIWMPAGLAVGGVGLFAGMLVGRPLARLLVVMLLPPRVRAPLGALWTLQGLKVPGADSRRHSVQSQSRQ